MNRDFSVSPSIFIYPKGVFNLHSKMLPPRTYADIVTPMSLIAEIDYESWTVKIHKNRMVDKDNPVWEMGYDEFMVYLKSFLNSDRIVKTNK